MLLKKSSVFFLCIFTTSIAAFAQMSLTSLAFEHNGNLPKEYTCHYSQLNPPLIIKNAPKDALSLALTVYDPNNLGGRWAHWIVYNIDPSVQIIASGEVPGKETLNDFGKFHYASPCPLDGREHTYHFKLYALSEKLPYLEGSVLHEVERAMKGKIIESAELVVKYKNVEKVY